MTLPHSHKVDFARRKGNVPYPCHYCMNKLPTIEFVTDEKNIVLEFGKDEGDVPQTCMAGIHKPTEYGDCKAMLVSALLTQYKRWYPSEIFSFFTREYMMEMITDINCNVRLSRPMLIARSRKGYHTREQRIDEMIKEGIIDVSYDIDCNETYSLTEYGQMIADIITTMLDDYILVKQHGEPMGFELSRPIFEYVRAHPDCDAKHIYDHFDANYDYPETAVPLALESMVQAGYIEPTYSDDFTRIGYNTTQKGILRWRAMFLQE